MRCFTIRLCRVELTYVKVTAAVTKWNKKVHEAKMSYLKPNLSIFDKCFWLSACKYYICHDLSCSNGTCTFCLLPQTNTEYLSLQLAVELHVEIQYLSNTHADASLLPNSVFNSLCTLLCFDWSCWEKGALSCDSPVIFNLTFAHSLWNWAFMWR